MKTMLSIVALLCAQTGPVPPDKSPNSIDWFHYGAPIGVDNWTTRSRDIIIQNVVLDRGEALDLLNAIRVLTSPDPDYIEPAPANQYISGSSYPLYRWQDNSPAGLRRRADWMEKVEQMKFQRDKDIKHAWSVIDKFKIKVERVK